MCQRMRGALRDRTGACEATEDVFRYTRSYVRPSKRLCNRYDSHFCLAKLRGNMANTRSGLRHTVVRPTARKSSISSPLPFTTMSNWYRVSRFSQRNRSRSRMVAPFRVAAWLTTKMRLFRFIAWLISVDLYTAAARRWDDIFGTLPSAGDSSPKFGIC